MKLHQPLISIITVCWNETPTRINNTFNSVSAQSYQNIEHIVIDGGSQTDTLAALNEFSNQIACLISEPDQGLYDAMNKGAQLACGDFLFFLNVGDYLWESTTLERVVQFINTHTGFDWYYGNVARIDETGKMIGFSMMPKSVSRFYMYEETICHQTIFAKHDLFKSVGGFDLSYQLTADRDWILRVLSSGVRCMHTDLTVCGFELGGLASNVRERRKEVERLQQKHYSRAERVLYGLGWLPKKLVRRIRNRDITLPDALMERLAVCRREIP